MTIQIFVHVIYTVAIDGVAVAFTAMKVSTHAQQRKSLNGAVLVHEGASYFYLSIAYERNLTGGAI